MAVHRENRDMEVLALLLEKGGHQMKESDPNVTPAAHDDPARGRVIQGVELQLLLDEWSRELTVSAAGLEQALHPSLKDCSAR